MKKLVLLCGFFFFGLANIALAQPDPRDSVILESKWVAPNMSGHPAFTVRVFITNKDSLAYMYLVLAESTTIGTAYASLSRYPFGMYLFSTIIRNLTTTLNQFGMSVSAYYDGASPDLFVVGAGYYEHYPETIEPPNLSRKPVWEIKFDYTSAGNGKIVLDSTRIGEYSTSFYNMRLQETAVNFVPSVITVLAKGDLNLDYSWTPTDVVLIINAVILNVPPPRGFEACDLNCDGERTTADVVVMINMVFLGEDFPC